jgi:hypothetical protein
MKTANNVFLSVADCTYVARELMSSSLHINNYFINYLCINN